MHLSGIDLIAVITYLIVVLAIGFFSSRRQTGEGFLIADRRLTFWNLVATITAGFLGGGVLIAFTAYVYQFGLSAIWFPAGISAGLLLFLLLYKKLKLLSDQRKFYTLSDYFYFRYGNRVGLLSAVIIFIWAFCLILMQFIAGGRVLATISGFSYATSVLMMGVVVFIYLVLGGFKAVVKTDIFQYLIILVLGLVIVVPLKRNLQLLPEQLSLVRMGLSQSVAFLAIGAFNIVVSADLWQRIYAAKDARHARTGIVGSALLVILVGLILSMIGLAAKSAFPEIVPDEALMYGVSSLLPSGLLGLGLVVLFAVIMSTLDTMLFIVSMNISQDIVSHHTKLNQESLVRITRYSMLILAFIGMLISIFVQSIIDVGLALTGIGLSLVPAILASFYVKLKSKSVLISALTGLAAIAVVLGTGTIGPETSVASLPISAVFLLIGQIIFKNEKKDDKANE